MGMDVKDKPADDDKELGLSLPQFLEEHMAWAPAVGERPRWLSQPGVSQRKAINTIIWRHDVLQNLLRELRLHGRRRAGWW